MPIAAGNNYTVRATRVYEFKEAGSFSDARRVAADKIGGQASIVVDALLRDVGVAVFVSECVA